MKPTWKEETRLIRDCCDCNILNCEICLLSTVYLALLYGCCVFVTHRADLHSSLPLSVTLVKELLHYTIGPLAIQLQGLGGVT